MDSIETCVASIGIRVVGDRDGKRYFAAIQMNVKVFSLLAVFGIVIGCGEGWENSKAAKEVNALQESLFYFDAKYGLPINGATNIPSYALVDIIRRKAKTDFVTYLGVSSQNERLGFYDPWKHSYVFVFRDSGYSSAKQRKRLSLVVYSCGRNGKFEAGGGDDIKSRGIELLME